jgi:hypothetical protein
LLDHVKRQGTIGVLVLIEASPGTTR